MALSKKRKIFSEHWVTTGNATESCIKAGYAPKAAKVTGARLLKNKEVKQYIEKLTAKTITNRVLTATEIKEFLSSVVRGEYIEESTEVISKIKDGQPIPFQVTKRTNKASLKDKILAAEKLAKLSGYDVNDFNNKKNEIIIISGEEDLED